MTRNLWLAGAALLAWAVVPAAMAQTTQDQETRELIERLRPAEAQTRGLRRPGADAATPAPAGSDVSAPSATPNVAQETTAPAGLSAVSITVNFGSGSSTLTPQASMALTALGQALAAPELQPFRFRIEGHTDTVGDAGMNMLLSQRRAEAVRDYLLRRFSIAPARLVAVGYGEAQLLIPTGDNMPEPRNRRVQVVNLGG